MKHLDIVDLLAQSLIALASILIIFGLFGGQPPLISVLCLMASAVALEAERRSGSLTGVRERLAWLVQFGLLAPAMVALAEAIRATGGDGLGQPGSYLLAVAGIIALRDWLAGWLPLRGRSRVV